MRVWITKWALTRGVMVREDATMHIMDTISVPGMRHMHKGDWHATPEAAAARVKEMAEAKTRSLDSQKRKIGELKRLLGLGKLPGLEGVKC